MPSRLCSFPRCPHPATNRGRCATHARDRERAINRPGYSLYRTKRWKTTRRRVLFDQPLCSCGELATDVDHITPLAKDGDPFALSNLQALCHRCHSRKTRLERATA